MTSGPLPPPDQWLPPASAPPPWHSAEWAPSPPEIWASPSPGDWRPYHVEEFAAPGRHPASPAGGPMAGLLVFLVVVAMAIAGVVGTKWQDTFTVDDVDVSASPASPASVTTPTVAPVPAEPPPLPPDPFSMGTVDPVTGQWLLPEWEWDVLPTLLPDQEMSWQILQGTDLSDRVPPTLVGCEEPRIVEDDEDYQDAVRRQWTCVHDAWSPMFEELGWSTTEPPVKFFDGAGTSSACGYAEAPAFYCAENGGTVFFGGDDRDLAMYWDLTINETVHHEYGHHIQNLAGIIDAVEEVAFTDDLDRRLELQATCLSASMTFHNEAVAFDQVRWDDWQYSLAESEIDDVHGSLESLHYWGTRGLYAKTLGDCNTWSVGPGRVD